MNDFTNLGNGEQPGKLHEISRAELLRPGRGIEARINQAVTDGKMTQAEADTKLADVTTRVTDFVNSTPELRDGRDHGRGHDDADDTDDANATDATATTDTVSTAG